MAYKLFLAESTGVSQRPHLSGSRPPPWNASALNPVLGEALISSGRSGVSTTSDVVIQISYLLFIVQRTHSSFSRDLSFLSPF